MRRTSPPKREPRDRTRSAASALALGALCAVLGACRASAPLVLPNLADDMRAAGELRVRLLFGDGADLDLYVTGPKLESVYFANSPSRIGGALDADVRCDADARPRVETIRFPDAPSGTYRVGVDFPERCKLTTDTARFAVEVEGDGLRERVEAEIGYGVFESRVLQIDYRPDR